MDFTPEVEDEVIRNSVSHRLDRPLVNPSNEVWRDSTQTQNPNPTFRIRDSLRYTNKGHNKMVDLLYINTNDPESTNYVIKFFARKLTGSHQGVPQIKEYNRHCINYDLLTGLHQLIQEYHTISSSLWV